MWKIRCAALAIILFAWGVLPWRSEETQVYLAVVLTLPLAVLLLRPQPGFALVHGLAGLLLALYLLLFAYGQAFGPLYIGALVVLHAVLAVVAWRPGGPASGRNLAYGFAFLLLSGAFFFLVDVGDVEIRHTRQAWAANLLRVVNEGQAEMAKSEPGGYAVELGRVAHFLKDPPSGYVEALASSRENSFSKFDYRFVLRPGPRDAAGRITRYQMTAQPDKKRYTSYFTDQSGVIRFCQGPRAATVQDPPR